MVSLVGFSTLKEHSEFKFFYDKGFKKSTPAMAIYYFRDSKNKVGFTATKKLGNAVKRNKAKRLMRALVIKNKDRLSVYSFVIVAREQIFTKSYEELSREFSYLLGKIEV